MSISQSTVEQLVKEMTARYGGSSQAAGAPAVTATVTSCVQGDYGIFQDINVAIDAAAAAQKQLMNLTLQQREKIIANMRKVALDNARHLAEMAHQETGYGHVEHKVLKNILAAEKTPGIEDLIPRAFTGDYGFTLMENAPFGLLGAITPSTNPTATVINNSIGMVSAGNGVVFNPHPAAKKASCEAIKLMNRAIVEAGGPNNLLVAPETPTLDTGKVIMTHKLIRLLVVTGGEAVVKVAMNSGKKVIAAGPGNPPVIVDDTANIKKAAKDIVDGASFDNNVLCIAEKEIIAFDNIADELLREMEAQGCYKANKFEVEQIIKTAITFDKEGKAAPNRKLVGRNASYILEQCGIKVNKEYKLIIADVPFDNLLVSTEMLMPVVPLTRVFSIEEAIDKAVTAENGCHHTAMMHSENVNHLSAAAKALDTTIFVKNAPSYAGLGFDGEGYTTLTIATPTGEGLTSAKNFVRSRRCTMYGAFRIV